MIGRTGDARMRRAWDALAAIIITAILINVLVSMVRPYIPYLLIGIAVYIMGSRLYRRSQHW